MNVPTEDEIRGMARAVVAGESTLLKVRRTICRRDGWDHDEWYMHWAVIGDEMENFLRGKGETKP